MYTSRIRRYSFCFADTDYVALTNKQSRFVKEYLVDLNATQAAIRAGFSEKHANRAGAQLMANEAVASEIQKGMNKRAERLEIKSDDVLREIMRIAFLDLSGAYGEMGLLPIRLMPENVRRAIAGVKYDENGIAEVKTIDKIRALELLGKHLKLFSADIEINIDSTLADRLAKAKARVKK